MRVGVIGGGIAGLTAAYELAKAGVEAVIFEGSDRIGGKLHRKQIGGLRLDVGAEAILARRPEGVTLAEKVGLDEAIVHPLTAQAAVWTRGAIRPLPPTVMGIPADIEALMASGIVEDMPESVAIPLPEHDISIAEFVSERVGREILDRLVEPLLGGTYAGHADRLSLAAAGAQLRALGDDVLASAATTLRERQQGPVFAGLRGGVGQLPDAVAVAACSEIRLNSTIRGIENAGSRFELHLDRGTAPVDAVIVAAPAPAAGRLLSGVAPEAAFELADIEYASMAIATFVFEADLGLTGSGFLVPPVDRTAIKAATFSSNKWQWVADSNFSVIRASVGRRGETEILHQSDQVVTAQALADLTEALGPLPAPVATDVHRWGGGLPQYDVGHQDRVAAIDRVLAQVRGLDICGAAYRGIGIPAAIASAQDAVHRVLKDIGRISS